VPLAALASVTALGAMSIGVAAGAGSPAMTSMPSFRSVDVTSAVASAMVGAVSAASDGAVPAATESLVPPSVPAVAPAAIACPSPPPEPLIHTQPSVPASLHRSVAATRPVAAFLGDSYTTGYNGAGVGRSGWPAIVAAALGLRPTVRAVAGTGFVNPGWTGQPIRSRLPSVISADPRVVFLVGGHNDRRFATARSTKAAGAVLDRLHRALPDATLVVIGPIWADGNTPRSLRLLRDHLRRKATAIGAIFIDPLRDGWFAGKAHRFIGPDGIHPTDAGHRHIASLVMRALRADLRLVTTPVGAFPSPSACAP